MAQVLVVDDDKAVCKMLADATVHLGHEVSVAHSLAECLERMTTRPPDVIFTDAHLPDGSALDVLEVVRKTPSPPTVIVMTEHGTPETAEAAIRNGAWDYIAKPLGTIETVHKVLLAVQYCTEHKHNNSSNEINRTGIIGHSPSMQFCMEMIHCAAKSDLNTLITGETGTGKELFALSIHSNSKGMDENFVVVDCTALPETLVESILFGHSKGAFTGADKAEEGLVRQAHKGTLFLDEIGELPLSLQKAFLRVLQEHRFRPVGGQKEVESDFRLISATNKNLGQMVEAGEFRGDLLYRLGAMTIHLPPLRSHIDDVEEIVTFYLKKVCRRFGVPTKKASEEFLKYLMLYAWPGNVRELFHVLEHACSAAMREETLFPIHLPQEMRIDITRSLFGGNGSAPVDSNDGEHTEAALKNLSLKTFRQSAYSNLEATYLKNLISSSSGNIKQACGISKLSRTRLYGLLKKYDIRSSI